ncbi:MAG TPA: tRNA (adenosine(37)-N6)-threonylcarbamoyltransferase complex ATPase subunit type 1 TsaE [Acidimicrobiales bacterium]|nr:tRNA (adenosine(37)-N6)-threonylcarbamoyltransferase complex ATPase subunit type 1 TsaE [Acidimicrobiales bacterium]
MSVPAAPAGAGGRGDPPALAWELEAVSDGAAATRSLAGRLARVCRAGDVVLLSGELGAGKTTFAQGFARGLGIEGPVTSPTFTLVRQYPCAAGEVRQLVHADVYRLDSLDEMADLALPELGDDAVTLVEWGERAAPVLGSSTLTVVLERPGQSTSEGSAGDDEERLVHLVARGLSWVGRCGEVADALGGFLRNGGAGRARRGEP